MELELFNLTYLINMVSACNISCASVQCAPFQRQRFKIIISGLNSLLPTPTFEIETVIKVSTGNSVSTGNFVIFFWWKRVLAEFPAEFFKRKYFFRRKLSSKSKPFLATICGVAMNGKFIVHKFNHQYIISLDIKSEPCIE